METTQDSAIKMCIYIPIMMVTFRRDCLRLVLKYLDNFQLYSTYLFDHYDMKLTYELKNFHGRPPIESWIPKHKDAILTNCHEWHNSIIWDIVRCMNTKVYHILCAIEYFNFLTMSYNNES